MECLSYCIAEKIDLSCLEKALNKTGSMQLTRYRYLLQLTLSNDPDSCQRIYIFANGSIVSWGIKRYLFTNYLDMFAFAYVSPLKKIIIDKSVFNFGNKTTAKPHRYFNVDCLTLENDDAETMLALSYAFSRSIKLNYYENILEQLIEQYQPVMRQASTTGRMRLSRKKIRQAIANIVSVKSEINLLTNFHNQPRYLWEHPSVEADFKMLDNYLDISERTQAFNERLNTLNEIFDMLNSYLVDRRSYHMELIIVVLIAAEIFFSMIHIHLTL